MRRGPWSPTQVVTILPAESKVTEAQSATWKLDVRPISRPSGPNQVLRSVCHASTCRLLNPLGAMNGWRGGEVAVSGRAVAGEPVNLGSEPASGPSWIGVAAGGAAPPRATSAPRSNPPSRAIHAAFCPLVARIALDGRLGRLDDRRGG